MAVLFSSPVFVFDLEDRVPRVRWVFAWMTIIACSNEGSDIALGREFIPAEWTVAEDTSGAGEVTTSSVQLPTAREIGGLLQDDTPQLVLRCLEGRVAVFIDTDPTDSTVPADSGVSAPPVRVDLDAAPPCE